MGTLYIVGAGRGEWTTGLCLRMEGPINIGPQLCIQTLVYRYCHDIYQLHAYSRNLNLPQ